VVRGLETLTRGTAVELLTDSVYVGKGLTEWLAKWKANGWRRREGKRWAEVKTGARDGQDSQAKFKAAQAKAAKLGVENLTKEDVDGLTVAQLKELRGY